MNYGIFRRGLRIFLFTASLIATSSGAADANLSRIEREMFASWIVEVQDEGRTRTLHIKGAEPRQDGGFDLDALYGWTDTRQTTIKARLNVEQNRYKLTLTTQANSIIVAESTDPSSMTGTFTLSSGVSKPIKLTRVTQDALSQIQKDVAAGASRAIVQPGPDVPAECASLIGGWNGHWGSGYGEEWLWIVQVDASCTAKYRFGRSGYWGPFTTAEIRKGVLSTPCAQGGTCSFNRNGEELWGNWYGPGGSNSIVLKKVPIENK